MSCKILFCKCLDKYCFRICVFTHYFYSFYLFITQTLKTFELNEKWIICIIIGSHLKYSQYIIYKIK